MSYSNTLGCDSMDGEITKPATNEENIKDSLCQKSRS